MKLFISGDVELKKRLILFGVFCVSMLIFFIDWRYRIFIPEKIIFTLSAINFLYLISAFVFQRQSKYLAKLFFYVYAFFSIGGIFDLGGPQYENYYSILEKSIILVILVCILIAEAFLMMTINKNNRSA